LVEIMSDKKRRNSSSSKRKKPVRRKDSQRLKMVVAALFVSGFLVLCLVVFAHLRHNLRSRPPVAPPVAEKPVPARSTLLSEIQLEVDSALWRAGVPFDRLQIVTRPETIRYEIKSAMPRRAVFDHLAGRLRELSPLVEVQWSKPGKQLTIACDRVPMFLLNFYEDFEKIPPVRPRPRVAIIVDDLGQDLAVARDLLDIDLSLTFSVMPHTEKARQVADLAHRRGREVMLHIPMEPLNYPAVDPGSDALFVGMPRKTVQQKVRRYLQQVPHVVGANNHMGSRYTEVQPGMSAVLDVLRSRQLFFIDSRTSARSVAAGAARQAGVSFAARDVFLDNVRDVEAIAREVRKLAGLARRKGQAIGICHPYPQTIAALRQEVAVLRSQGVEVVPASSLVAKPEDMAASSQEEGPVLIRRQGT
jgi:polysaccharide deacetylase 2 family uncharacterized protein YibQ